MDHDRMNMTNMAPHPFERPGSDIQKAGYLKKLKTMKRKWFVLRSTSSSGPARLEYFDNESKFKAGGAAKRAIQLHTCFNINKKSDSRRGRLGIVLYTSDECFTVLAENEAEQEAWLSLMLQFQNQYLPDVDMHKEHYEYVWQVVLQAKGLGQGKGAKGHYRFCLNSTTVCLVKTNSSQPQFAIQLVTIRSVAHNDCSFRLEVGKYAPMGEGEFWFSVEDSNIAKHMHETLLHYMNTVKDPPSGQFRKRSESHSSMSPGRQGVVKPDQRPISFYTPSPGWQPLDMVSPSSPGYPSDHRPRSNTAESRSSHASSHVDDIAYDFGTYNTDGPDGHFNVVPSGITPPSSPNCLEEEMNAYMAMDKTKHHLSGMTPPTNTPPYMAMNIPAHGHAQKADVLSPSIPEAAGSTGYVPMNPTAASQSHMSAPIPIHSHSFSEPHHSTPLPTVREGGSNEGYFPMDVSSSPSSMTAIPHPDQAMCMLSDDSTGLPSRTYSLGSKPIVKKHTGYIEMGPLKGAAGHDMSRAISAPHIIHGLKGRKDRDHRTNSPTPSASPLSTSFKSDDSDSFTEYMAMRPRTASDSFNYRPRTSSFGKLQQTCRPRSSSHGQGTRPFNKFSKLTIEKARISRESSLHGSFDSLRVSNESLRRTSQDTRQSSGSGDCGDARGTPSPQLKSLKAETDGYVSMQLGPGPRKSSPHQMRADPIGSGRRIDTKSPSSERLHQQQQPGPAQSEDYTEMTPHHPDEGEAYMNMDFGSRQSFSSDTKSASCQSSCSLQSGRHGDSVYMNMDLENKKRSEAGRSVSMENVDTYVIYDPAHGANKPRTGSLGSKDKKVISRPGSARKSSSTLVSSGSSPSSSLLSYHSPVPQPSVSASSRKGGSSDSIRSKTSRQSSVEKTGSLGRDFRKKSASTGSRPHSSSKGRDQVQQAVGSGVMPVRRLAQSKTPVEDLGDEYIEFAPTRALVDNPDAHPHFYPGPSSHTDRNAPSSTISSLFSQSVPSSISISSSSNRVSHPIGSAHTSTVLPISDTYTIFSPGFPISSGTPSSNSSSSKAVHFQSKLPHHHLSSVRAAGQASFSTAQAKPNTEKDTYVGFEPWNLTAPSSAAVPLSQHAKQIEAKEVPEYIGFEPGIIPSSSSSLPAYTKQSAGNAVESSEYIGFDPGVIPQHCPHQSSSRQSVSAQHTSQPISPDAMVSYIQGSSDDVGSRGKLSEACRKSKHKQSSSKQTSMDSALSKPMKSAEPRKGSCGPAGLPSSSSLNFEPSWPIDSGVPSTAVSESGGCNPWNIPVPPLPTLDDSDYLKYSPAIATANKSSLSKENTAPRFAAPSSGELGMGAGLPEVSQVAAPKEVSPNKSQQKKQNQQRPSHHQERDYNFQRQTSAPAGITCGRSELPTLPPSVQPVQSLSLQPPTSPQAFSPQTTAENYNPIASGGSGRHKHLSGSSHESSSPTFSSGSRHKHSSGSSGQSQKSGRASSDSEKSLRNGSKSDSNSSLTSSGGKNKRRAASGEKSPAGSAERSPLSPAHGSGEFFCGEMSPISSKALEAKILPVESKIRHSLGDMTSVVGVVNKEGQGHGLARPGSTPCMHNLDNDPGSRSAGDVPSTQPHPAASLGFTAGPRSRHSLSDLGAYQQMSVGGQSNLANLNREHNNTPASCNPQFISSSSNNNYICASTNSGGGGGGGPGGGVGGDDGNSGNLNEPVPKPLNYVKLDLSCKEAQGDADTRSPRVKSRNSSDADEKQPPLSYAQIDFVKSQNLNLARSLGCPDNTSSSKP